MNGRLYSSPADFANWRRLLRSSCGMFNERFRWFNEPRWRNAHVGYGKGGKLRDIVCRLELDLDGMRERKARKRATSVVPKDLASTCVPHSLVCPVLSSFLASPCSSFHSYLQSLFFILWCGVFCPPGYLFQRRAELCFDDGLHNGLNACR